MTYTGKTLKQSKLTVTVNGKKLSAKTDYTVKYKNNKNIGKATITITGKGNYKGTVKKTFQIKVSKKKAYVVEDIKYKVTKEGINKKVVVNVPKKQYKKYVSLMKKGNVPSKVTYKKVK